MGNAQKKPIYKKWWFWVIAIIVAGAIASNFTGEAEQPETTSNIQVEELSEQQQATIDSLDDFDVFIENYKQLGDEKTPTWDNYLNGETVTWTGTVMDTGSSQVFVWGGDDYSGQTWSTLPEDGHKRYNVFVAKFEDGTPDAIKVGDTITITGKLESRGDYELDYNWKIYESEIKE